MGTTTTTANLKVTQWIEDFFRFGRMNMYFGDFIGGLGPESYVGQAKGKPAPLTDSNAMIQLQMDLTKKQGETLVFPQIYPLTENGRVDSTMESHEESISQYDSTVTLHSLRNAVRDTGGVMRQQPAFKWPPVIRNQLAQWYGYIMDKFTYRALAGLLCEGEASNEFVAARLPSRKYVGGTAPENGEIEVFATDAEIKADDYMSLEWISFIRATAVASEPTVRPIIIDGQEKYMFFMHPYHMQALRASTTWKDVQKFSAGEKGKMNLVYRHAMGEWDNVLLFEYQRTETRLGTSSGVNLASNTFDGSDQVTDGAYVGRALFCGAQACLHALCSGPRFVEKKFDYDYNWGLCVEMILGISVPVFNGIDYGVIVVDTAFTTPS